MRRCEYECVCWAMVEYGDAECPGPCDAYAPMVDVDALLELASAMQDDAAICPHADYREHICSYARQIREALGVEQ